MVERRSRERWLEKLFVAMRRLARLRELRYPEPDSRNARIDEAIAKEPDIIRRFYEETAKTGALPLQWPESVAAIAEELGLRNGADYKGEGERR